VMAELAEESTSSELVERVRRCTNAIVTMLPMPMPPTVPDAVQPHSPPPPEPPHLPQPQSDPPPTPGRA
jgi:hypothetical protein